MQFVPYETEHWLGLKLNLTFPMYTVVEPEDHFTIPSLGRILHQGYMFWNHQHYSLTIFPLGMLLREHGGLHDWVLSDSEK